MKWNVGTKIGAAFGATLAIFLIVGIVTYQSTTQLIADSDARKHSFEVLRQLDEMLSSLKDVEIGQRSFILTGDERFLEPYQQGLATVDKAVQTLSNLAAGNPDQQRRIEALEPLIKSRLDFAQSTIEMRRTQGFQPALESVKGGQGRVAMDGIRRALGQMEAEETRTLAQQAAAAQADAQQAKSTIVIGTLLATMLAALTGFLITRNIARPLREMTALAERISAGDLGVKMTADSRGDEVGALARAFDRMARFLREMATAAEQIAAGDLRSTVTPQSADDVLGRSFARMSEQLSEQIRGLVEGANVLGAAASEIVASTAQLAAAASQSAAAVTETTTTVEEVRQTAQLASQKAKFVAEGAQKAVQVSEGGRKSASDVIIAMNRIRQQMEAISGSMMRLSEQSQAIGQIMAAVEDLAAQSTLLAVNAAIEAAKAGDQGKGFGVVAQEVKSLAEQSRQATSQVRALLGDIQKATTAAVLATEQGSKAVEAGTAQTEVSSEAIDTLAGSVSEAAQAATQIAASSQQQSVGVDQVAAAMDSIKQASTQNVASARQLESAARSLNELGQRMKQMVDRYRV